MNKPRNRNKPSPRPRPTRKSARLAAEKSNSSEVGQAACLPSSPPSSPPSPLPEPQQIDLILRLWENGSFTLTDIALKLPMADFITLLQRPDIAALLDQMGQLLDLRLKHIAAKAAIKALTTLEQVQTEAEQAATSTPVSPEAIKADRRAATARNHRRLSASAILTMHRSLKAAQKPTPKAAPATQPSETMLHGGGMAMQSMAMRTAEPEPMQKSA